MVLAISARVYEALIPVLIAEILLRFYVARRIGQPKGREWFWYAFFLWWIGVIILASLRPKGAVEPADEVSEYHIPPGIAQQPGPKHWMYERRR